MRRVVIVGAGGRDFHDFAMVYRDDPGVEVVAFTAAQIPGIDDRRYPASLAGPRYPAGIPIRPQSELAALIREHSIDEVAFAYSDLSHVEVMHLASEALAAGASFTFHGPAATMLRSSRPVVAVCATRTGCGKSQTARRIGQLLMAAGLRVALIRHPMPYGDLEAMRVQRFSTLAEIDASNPTVEEREEYEEPVRLGMLMYAGVDYAAILGQAEAEADVIIWDGGNNDLPFVRPDLMFCVTDALRPGDGRTYHPGETNLRMADVIVVNKVDVAEPTDIARALADAAAVNPDATVIRTASPVELSPGPDLTGLRVLVIEDGPTITHGGMPFGAGTVAARRAGAGQFVDPRPVAVGSIAETFERYPHVGHVLPAMGYGDAQLRDLSRTIAACDCDVVVIGTPMDLPRLIAFDRPVRRASYELRDVASPTLPDVLAPWIERWTAR